MNTRFKYCQDVNQGIPKQKDTARFSPVQQAFTKTYMAEQRTKIQRTPGKEIKTLRRTSSI